MSRYFCKQKTAYGMHISDWSSDVCSSDLAGGTHEAGLRAALTKGLRAFGELIGQKKAAQITADDLLGGGEMMLSVFIRDTQFQSQTKDSLSSPEEARLTENAVRDHFEHCDGKGVV